jgi:ABC-type multidrug transport system ATPase subunit
MRVSQLRKCYGEQTVLADVTFDVRAGEVLGLIGPNGSGKTTLLEAVAGLLPDVAGEVLWHTRVLPLERRRDRIFFLPDGLKPWGEEYVARVIGYFAAIYRHTDARVAETVRAVGLDPVLRKRVSALSKGFGRRLVLALAFLTPHPILLLDEPFDGFDLRQTRDIMAMLRGIAARGRSFVLAIHQLADAERVCDRLVLLADGKVRGFGTLDELRARAGRPAAGLEEVFLALT